jgi:hypothetical protein
MKNHDNLCQFMAIHVHSWQCMLIHAIHVICQYSFLKIQKKAGEGVEEGQNMSSWP